MGRLKCGKVQLAYKLSLVDPVEAFRDVGVQAILGLLLDRDEDLSDRIMNRPARSKAVAVGLKLRFPLRL
jgi:hypothetical protein